MLYLLFSLVDRFACGKEIIDPSSFYSNPDMPTTFKYPSLCQLNNFSATVGNDYDCRALYLERALNLDAFGVREEWAFIAQALM